MQRSEDIQAPPPPLFLVQHIYNQATITITRGHFLCDSVPISVGIWIILQGSFSVSSVHIMTEYSTGISVYALHYANEGTQTVS